MDFNSRQAGLAETKDCYPLTKHSIENVQNSFATSCKSQTCNFCHGMLYSASRPSLSIAAAALEALAAFPPRSTGGTGSSEQFCSSRGRAGALDSTKMPLVPFTHDSASISQSSSLSIVKLSSASFRALWFQSKAWTGSSQSRWVNDWGRGFRTQRERSVQHRQEPRLVLSFARRLASLCRSEQRRASNNHAHNFLLGVGLEPFAALRRLRVTGSLRCVGCETVEFAQYAQTPPCCYATRDSSVSLSFFLFLSFSLTLSMSLSKKSRSRCPNLYPPHLVGGVVEDDLDGPAGD